DSQAYITDLNEKRPVFGAARKHLRLFPFTDCYIICSPLPFSTHPSSPSSMGHLAYLLAACLTLEFFGLFGSWDCGLVVRPDQPCGLEPIAGLKSSGMPAHAPQPCSSGDETGRWVVPCLSCSDNRTCDWREVAWQPNRCYHPVLEQPLLQTCMMDKKVLFIGDSTNRGMMYYLMERVNTTLEDWDKAHDTIVYHNLNQGRTLISYSYYPQFWLHKNQRPTFQRALQQLIEREKLRNIMVVVKSLGMGFHLPVDGIRSLSVSGVQELYGVNKNILESAKRLGYEVIDTFSITMGRYKEFLQGRCACHFHEVGRPSVSTVPAHRKLQIVRPPGEGVSGISTQSASVQHQEEARSQHTSPYHVKGAVNQVYSEILLSRVCLPYDKKADSSRMDKKGRSPRPPQDKKLYFFGLRR
ncbi:hypothetical protein NFI96_026964, partial [Prochilodus magdalenae]